VSDADRVKQSKAVQIIKALRKRGVGDGLARNLDSVSSGEMYGYLLQRGWMWARNQNNFVKQKELPMGGMMDKVKIEQIRLDGGTQSRAEMNMTTVEEYAEAMKEGAQFPPVIVFYDGQDYWLADGFHRVAAAKKAELIEIAADVRQGEKRDAVLMSVSVNSNHGLRRTQADKRRAIEVLLRDDTWREWSDREIARRVSVDHKTVGSVRAELVQRGEIPMLDTRKVARGENEYTVTKNSYPPTPAAELDVETARQIAVYAVGGDRELLRTKLANCVHWDTFTGRNDAPVWFGANTVEINGEKLKVGKNQIAVELSTVNGVGLYRFDAYQLFDWGQEREDLLNDRESVQCLLRLALTKNVYVSDGKIAKKLVKYGLALTDGTNNQLTITGEGRKRAEPLFRQSIRAIEKEIILSLKQSERHYIFAPFSGEEALMELYEQQEEMRDWVRYADYESERYWLAKFETYGYTQSAVRETVSTTTGFKPSPTHFYIITPAGCALIGCDPLPEPEPLPDLPYHTAADMFIAPDDTFTVQIGDRVELESGQTGVISELRQYPQVTVRLDKPDQWNNETNFVFENTLTVLKSAGEIREEPGSSDNHIFTVGEKVEYRDWGMHDGEYGMKWVPVEVIALGEKRVKITHLGHPNKLTHWAEPRNLRPIAAQITQPAEVEQPDSFELPLPQITFLQDIYWRRPVTKNAATRLALRNLGLITQDEDWGQIQLTPAGKQHIEKLERNRHTFNVGDRVMTRAGHEGTVININGALIKVQTAYMIGDHKPQTLTKITAPAQEPTEMKRHNDACFMAAWYALLQMEEQLGAVVGDGDRVLMQHIRASMHGVKEGLAYRLNIDLSEREEAAV
jgi:preprotein translocase subunit YajC